MSGAGHVRTLATRELLGPAEGQYVTTALLGTDPGQQQNTGRDSYGIVVPVLDGGAIAGQPVAGPQLCARITWDLGPGRQLLARLAKADCSMGTQGSDTGVVDICLPATSGDYVLDILNPLDDSQEFSFAYTLTITGPVGTDVSLILDEGAEAPLICEK